MFIFAVGIFPTQAQNRCNDTISVFGGQEKLPVFNRKLSGSKEFNEFVVENLKYPKTAIEDKIEGRVIVEFWIDTFGITCDHRIIRGVRKDLDDEALRVVKLLKFDTPATNGGKLVGMCFKVPITFSLSEKVKPLRKLKKK